MTAEYQLVTLIFQKGVENKKYLRSLNINIAYSGFHP